MQTTFNELLTHPHISMSSIANCIGKTRQWVSVMHTRQDVQHPELMRKHYLTIQQSLQKWALDALRAGDPYKELFKLLRQSPLNLSSLSVELGKGRWWLRDIAAGTVVPSMDERVIIAVKVREMASILHDIVLLDFIEHDYVASHLINQNKFNGLVV